MEIQVREAIERDVPGILEIYNNEVLSSTATFDLEPQTLEQRLEWFSHYGGKHPLIAAVKDDKVTGYSCLSVFRSKPAYDRTVELSIYVHKDFRGQGIGHLLMKEILERARVWGHHIVVAVITSGNKGSIRFHEEFGFEYTGRLNEVGYKFGQWMDVLFYQLKVGS